MDSKLLLKQIEHFDKLGALLNVGDYVAYPHMSTLQIGQIIKLNPKMVKIKGVNKPPKRQWRESPGVNRYPHDCVLVSGDLVTMYILRNL